MLRANRPRSHRAATPGSLAANALITLALIVLGLMCLLPFWYEVCVSFSSNQAVIGNQVYLWPKDFAIESYRYVMERAPFWHSMWVTVQRVLLSLPISLFLMVTAAYPLSKDKSRFKSRSLYVWYFFITMLFNGGMIPQYLLIVQLGLLNNIFSLVLPGAFNVFNMLLILSFFRNISASLDDAARMDGAGQWRALFQIYAPISLPVLATVTLFTLVGNWNSWFDGMIYMKSNNAPLQTYLRTVVFNYDFGKLTMEEQQRLAKMSPEGIKAAQMVIGALPILAVYPFLQKYFITGITLGSVKE